MVFLRLRTFPRFYEALHLHVRGCVRFWDVLCNTVHAMKEQARMHMRTANLFEAFAHSFHPSPTAS
eukprot:10450426-Alexandrium_andersonii.AAC.1